MSLFLSKLLPRLVYPLGLTTGLLLLAISLVWWAAFLERQYLPVPVAQPPVADAIVVLGGGVAAQSS